MSPILVGMFNPIIPSMVSHRGGGEILYVVGGKSALWVVAVGVGGGKFSWVTDRLAQYGGWCAPRLINHILV